MPIAIPIPTGMSLARDWGRDGSIMRGSSCNIKSLIESITARGTLILYQSWNEMAVPPRTIIDYYSSVEKAMGGPERTQDFARLFMVAGDGMCPGFGNAEDFNTLKA
jgi:hypothetical protein